VTRILALLEVVLVTIGATCLGWYGGVRVAAAREQTRLSHELEIAAADLPPEGGHYGSRSLPPKGGGYVTGALVGRIEMPRIKLSAVAREGVDERTLDLSVGHVPGTAMPGEPGNAAFAEHRDTFFRPLRHVRQGDIVAVTTPNGTYRYLVTAMRVVEPDEVSVLDATGEPTLTLVTCYPFDFIGSAPHRFIVRGTLLS